MGVYDAYVWLPPFCAVPAGGVEPGPGIFFFPGIGERHLPIPPPLMPWLSTLSRWYNTFPGAGCQPRDFLTHGGPNSVPGGRVSFRSFTWTVELLKILRRCRIEGSGSQFFTPLVRCCRRRRSPPPTVGLLTSHYTPPPHGAEVSGRPLIPPVPSFCWRILAIAYRRRPPAVFWSFYFFSFSKFHFLSSAPRALSSCVSRAYPNSPPLFNMVFFD